ncbi:armadillo-type protein [Cubamyces lactineus]|nr:armadillo-type protein [Cubamyces lactineus]
MSEAKGPQSAFQRLKSVCVPLLGNSLLTPASIPTALRLLSQLGDILRQLHSSAQPLTTPTITYVFFPLSTILRRNELANIPDQVLERVLDVLSLLCDAWWWDMDIAAWEQVFMLCSAILGGIDRKGKGKDRDEETKVAATSCLWALLRERTPLEDLSEHPAEDRAPTVIQAYRNHAQTAKFLPILGQTLNSLLLAAESPHLPLQRISLKVLSAIIGHYLPDGFVPSVLPGVISSMSKVALGSKTSKGWANGDIVAEALLVMQYAIVRAVGDEICVREGAVRSLDNLDDLVANPHTSSTDHTPSAPYVTRRTESWLRGTVSQLHIAMNALSPLVKHPTPVALIGLAEFSTKVLSATTITMPLSRPLLISFLLSLKVSPFERVAELSDVSLRQVLGSHNAGRHHILQTLLQISRDNLAALPRLLLSHADSKVEHAAHIIASVCSLATPSVSSPSGITAISAGVGKLLGPHGRVEKWGWSLLSALEFVNPPIVVTSTSAAQLLLENDSSAPHDNAFPELTMRLVNSRSAYEALEQMFRALGATAGDECLFAVEWFVDVAMNGRSTRAVAALWCACRLLEGAGHISTGALASSSPTLAPGRTRRLEKFARDLARRIGETWDDADVDMEDQLPEASVPRSDAHEDNVLVEHVTGLATIRAVPGGTPSKPSAPAHAAVQPMLHRSLRLQLLSITAGILESRFSPLLLHTLYPVLHGIISDSAFESASAMAALSAITNHASYATPANLLLSNFDYCLDAVSRRLSRRWLDVDATKVLAVLVRLVGRDVVQKAGDVVEECFDRLDEYHGYEVIVDGLIEVLQEVVRVIEEDEANRLVRDAPPGQEIPYPTDPALRVHDFAEWFNHRHDKEQDTEPLRDSSYPREAWGKPEDDAGAGDGGETPQDDARAAESPSQALTRQIVSRSLYFLTHAAPQIRARILLMLANAVPVLPESALLPSVHQAWPFILNRLADAETFVVSAAATLISALATHVGDFMYRRIWDDVWPRFREHLRRLEQADASSALSRRGIGAVGTESAYTHSHRLYRAIIQTLTAAARGVQAQDATNWEILILFRRFLHNQVHDELQASARELYSALSKQNEDAVWLVMSATMGEVEGPMAFLREPKWDIKKNVRLILRM